MLIYNTTYHVEDSEQENFLIWIHEVYIPAVKQEGSLHEPRLLRVINHRDEGMAYALQWEVDSSAILHRWHLELGLHLNEEMTRIFQNKVTAFATLMEEIE